MRKYIRIMTVILALAMLPGAFISCAETASTEETTAEIASTTPQNPESASTAPETTLYEPDDLDEKYNLNETITFYIWSDHRMKEFYAEDSGNNIMVRIPPSAP